MKFTELINRYLTDKTPVFINGVGVGRITKVEADFISFEVVKEEEKALVKERTHFPIDRIEAISEGGQEVPKSEEDKTIDNDLGDL